MQRIVQSLARGDSAARSNALLDAGCVPPLASRLQDVSTSRLKQATRTLDCLASRSNACCDAIVAVRVLPDLASLLSHASTDVKAEAVMTMWFLAGGSSDRHSDAIVAAGCVPPLLALLSEASLVAPAAEAVQALASRGETCADVMMTAGAVPVLVVLLHGQLQGASEGAMIAFGHLVAGSSTHCDVIVPYKPGLYHSCYRCFRIRLIG